MGNVCTDGGRSQSELNETGDGKMMLRRHKTAVETIEKHYTAQKTNREEKKCNAPEMLQRSLYNNSTIETFPELSNKIKSMIDKLDPRQLKNAEEPAKKSSLSGPFQNPENKDIYYGEINKSMKHGWGKEIYDQGSFYQGYWKNDHTEGWGLLVLPGDSSKLGECFIGEWVDGELNGYAESLYMPISGEAILYKGHWVDGQRDGFGIEESDESRYEGQYKEGEKCGNGTYTWLRGNEKGNIYKGELEEDTIHGKGCYWWQDGRRYDGDWQYGKMNGKGTFTWADGRKYVGEYLKDNKHGYGEFFWPGKRSYKGPFEYGKQHGIGKYTDEKGLEVTRKWDHGKALPE